MNSDSQKTNNIDFISKDNSIKSAVDKYFIKRNSICKIQSLFNSSEITQCPVKLYYKSTGLKVDDINKGNVIGISEIFIKRKWIQILKKLEGISILAEDVQLSDSNYNLSGKADAVVLIENKKYILNVFPVKEDVFINVNKNGAIRKNVIEIITNMWLAEIKEGLMLYENKNSDEYLVLKVKLFKPIIESVKSKASLLFKKIFENKTPDMIYKNSENTECESCLFVSKCWEKMEKND